MDQTQTISAGHRQTLAENSVFKFDPLHAIWDVLCQIAGQRQVDSESLIRKALKTDVLSVAKLRQSGFEKVER